jgi:hypothetical protein
MKYYSWACDMSKNTGEGSLAKLFIKHKNLNIQKNLNFRLKSKIYNYKYILPFVGIFYCWYYFFKKKKICYINYLPLWNFFIFLLLPPKTLIGPITGGAIFNKSITRKYFFPIFYAVSQIIIYFRFDHIDFSTSLLKKNLYGFIKKKSHFNYVLHALKKKKKCKKNIDFLIYYRNHINKKSFFPYTLIKKLIILKYKVYIVGDKLEIHGVKNLKRITNKKLNYYLSKTRFSIASGENLLSFFTLECINNNVKILIDYKSKIDPENLKKNFIKTKFNFN